MTFKIEKKYMTVPVNTSASIKVLSVKIDGKTVYDTDCKVDMINPNFTAYIDVSRFLGATVDVSLNRNMEFSIGFADEIQEENEEYRPKVHFTVKNGWNNDPNGLIKYNGKYHMFYQYNPCSSEWGTMHWGHAVSDDLIKWEEKDIALYPDELGAMYSGSAIEDVKGVSGITNGKNSPMLIYYTAAAGSATQMSKGKKFTQCLAYSFDGEKFEKYDGNPIIGHIEGGNRDPKVVFVEEIGKYLLALYLAENRYCFFVSDDLVHWTHYQNISIPSDWECPDIYPLECDGERFWILMGARDYYLVGKFTENGYETVGSEKHLSCAGVNYAAQSFSGTGKRVVRVYWQRTKFPTPKVTQQMGIPVEMSLVKDGGEYYLKALPVSEILPYRNELVKLENKELIAPVTVKTGKKALDIELEAEWSADNKIRLLICGATVDIDFRKNEVVYGRNHVPLSLHKDKAKVRMIIDRCSLEVYADAGRYLLSDNLVCDFNLPFVTVSSDKPVTLDKLEIYSL